MIFDSFLSLSAGVTVRRSCLRRCICFFSQSCIGFEVFYSVFFSFFVFRFSAFLYSACFHFFSLALSLSSCASSALGSLVVSVLLLIPVLFFSLTSFHPADLISLKRACLPRFLCDSSSLFLGVPDWCCVSCFSSRPRLSDTHHRGSYRFSLPPPPLFLPITVFICVQRYTIQRQAHRAPLFPVFFSPCTCTFFFCSTVWQRTATSEKHCNYFVPPTRHTPSYSSLCILASLVCMSAPQQKGPLSAIEQQQHQQHSDAGGLL